MVNWVRQQIRRMVVVALVIIGCGCTSMDKMAGAFVPFYTYDGIYLTGIEIQADEDSNNNMPVAIDFVFIADLKVYDLLVKLSGPEWFKQKQGVLLQHQNVIAVQHVEVVPFTALIPVTLPDNYQDAKKVLMFANYINPKGQYLADISDFDELRLTLARSGYRLEEMDP